MEHKTIEDQPLTPRTGGDKKEDFDYSVSEVVNGGGGAVCLLRDCD
jgi:hypothetical protein